MSKILSASQFIFRTRRSSARCSVAKSGNQLLRSVERCCSHKAQTGVPYKTLQQSDESHSPDSVPKEADVVIIGGGSLGCSTLYHLTKLGVCNAVLLEKDHLTAGTTWHSAGLSWRLRPNDVDVELLKHTRNLAREILEQETELSTGWIENGGIFIAANKERLDEYKRLMTLGQVFGIDSHVLSPNETKKLYPLMNIEDLYGTLYSPGDGTIDPAGWATTLTRAAKKNGAQVYENCPVTGITTAVDDFGVKRVTSVQTGVGDIKTKAVVNCAGVWAPYLGEMVGVAVPLVAMYHAYVVTEKIDGIDMMPNIRDHDASVYLKLQGDGLSVGGYENNPIFWDKVSKEFAFGLFDLDWDVFGTHIEGAVNRVPVIGETGVKSTVCGPESFTADHKPLMGEAPEVRGYYLGCGFNSAGIMLAGGCGRELAQWITHGHPTLDMYGYDIRRFHTSLTSNQKWSRERSHESYAKNYSIVYPHDEPLASRNMRCDPFHQVLLDAGCVYQERLGWERPGWFACDSEPAKINEYDYYGAYGNERKISKYEELLSREYTFDFPDHHHIIGKECATCRTGVAAFNMSYFGKFYITGPDAQKAVDWIFSNNMQKDPGSTTYTCMLNKDGGVQADITVSVIEDQENCPGTLSPQPQGKSFYVAVGGGIAQHGWCHIKNILQDEKFDCQLIDKSEEMGMLSIQGPKSRELLQSLVDVDFSNGAFPFSTHKIATIAGHKMRIIRLTFVGELGYELHIPAESCIPVYNAVMKEGAKYGIINSGYRAIDSLSVEKGYKHWHQDLRHDDTPLESGLAFTCKLKSDTPFLGRDALEKQKAEGLKKRIICLAVDQHKALHGLEGIYRDGEPIGYVRRADFGHTVNKMVCYGYVTHPEGQVVTAKYLKAGTYTIDVMGEHHSATLHMEPVFDPKNERVKGNYDL